MMRKILLTLALCLATLLSAFSQNNALHFDGTNDFVAIPAVGTNLSSFTIEAWINPETTSPEMGIVNTNNWDAGSVHFQFLGGKVTLSVNGLTLSGIGGDWPKMTVVPTINKWQHVAVTYDGAAKKIIFYLNGVESGNYSATTMPAANFSAASIGAWAAGTGSRFYKGKMDEVHIWNKALTVTEVNSNLATELLGTESGLIAYYNFNPTVAGGATPTTTILLDKTSNHFDGALTNFYISNWIERSIGNNCLHFDGVDDYVDLGASAADNFSGGFSITGYIKWDKFNSWSRFIDFGNSSDADNILIANYGTTSTVTFSIRKGTAQTIMSTGKVLNPNQWYYIAATVSATGVAKLYVDGVLDKTATGFYLPNTIVRTKQYIGKSNWPSDAYFSGGIDNVSIWNKELSQAEVTTGATGFAGNESGLLHYYTFNQGTAGGNNTAETTLNDAISTGTKNGTLNNFNLQAPVSTSWVDGFVVQIAPGAPTEVSAMAGNASAAVYFTTPASNGGSPITTYTVTSNPDNKTATGSSSPLTVKGLSIGKAYTFTVVATNVNGTSIPSTPSATVTPYLAPAITSFTPKSGAIGTTVTITGTGFSPISGNNSVRFGAVRATVIAASATTLTVKVPAGAGSIVPISVRVGGLVSTSATSTTPTFNLTNTPNLTLGYASGTLAVGNSSTETPGPQDVKVDDFNNDGIPDIASANYDYYNITVQLGNGDGTFSIKTVYWLNYQRPLSLVSGDFNGDGKVDLAASTESGKICVMMGIGDGTFGDKTDYPVSEHPKKITIGDFNGDGKIDLATIGYINHTVGILLGNGNGTFGTITNYPVGNYPYAVAVTDFNGDKIADLAVVNYGSGSVSILLGNGDGSFAAKTDYSTGFKSEPHAISFGDFDSDGKTDIATANHGNSTVGFLLGNGDGTFKANTTFVVGEGPYSVSVGDFNGDGKTDIATANNKNTADKNRAVSILLGSGDGTFSRSDYGSFTRSMAIAVGDFNSDGKADLITANGWSHYLGILIYSIPPSVTTVAASSIAATSAVGGGNITDLGTPNPTQHGIVWSTTPNPTVALTSKTELGAKATTGAFTSSITGLLPGTTYYLRAYATNMAGTRYGDEVSFTTTKTIPLAPTAVSAIGGNEKAIVSFTAPASDGGSQIIIYTVTAIPGSITTSGTASPLTVTGLTNGISYTFIVTATNAIGTSSPSVPSNSVTPFIDTEKPIIINVPANILVSTDAGKNYATVTWSAPSAIDNVGVANFTTNHAIGSQFAIGITPVIYTATDAAGNTKTASFTVTVNDSEKPVISNMPANISVNTEAGKDYATVSWTAPSATDNVGVASFTSNHAIGSQFAPGNTSVIYTATDAAGNTETASFTVTVNDSEKPVISNMPANISVNTDAGKDYATVTWTEPTATDNVSVASFTYEPRPVMFLVGTTTITYTAVDAAGNNATASFTVTVNDSEKPVISNMPANISVSTEAGKDYATVTWTEPTATDNVGVASFTTNHAIGSQFATGNTSVIYTATDAAGNTETANFTVTVNDTEKPVISNMPANISVNTDAGKNCAAVTWTEPTATDNVGVASLTYDPRPAAFVIGTTTITYTAVDAAGNKATASFTVTVNDSEKPVISNIPANISVNTEAGKDYATVTWTEPTATDNVGVASFITDHAIGSQFAVGTTTVTYTATDAAGNIETASFTVTVTKTTGISTVTGSEINVYPNPATDLVNIVTGNSIDNGTYTILSISGTIVANGIIANGKATANIEELMCGTYIVQIHIGSKHNNYRIVKR